MIPILCTQVEVHLFRRRGRRVEFLLIRRSPDRSLPGVWQPVTGGIEQGEVPHGAAAREVREETGLTPLRWWALEHLTIHYDPAAGRVHAVPVFVAEVATTDGVHLSHEHDRYAFVSPAEAARRVLWQSQRRALRAIAEEVLRGGANAEARDITARIAALRPTRSAPRTPRPRPARRRGPRK